MLLLYLNKKVLNQLFIAVFWSVSPEASGEVGGGAVRVH